MEGRVVHNASTANVDQHACHHTSQPLTTSTTKCRLILIMAKKSSRRKIVEFQQKWVVKYGIRVSARDSAYGKVCSVECRFCRHFGRDDRSNPGEKRKRTAHIKMFTAPWRTDHILFHMTDQHPDQFKTYSELPDAQKKEYFPSADEGGSSPSPQGSVLP